MKKIILITLSFLSICLAAAAQKKIELVKAIYTKTYCTESEDPVCIIEFTEIGTNKKIEFTSNGPDKNFPASKFWNTTPAGSDYTVKELVGKKFAIVFRNENKQSEVGEITVKYMSSCDEIPSDNYPKATCKVYDALGIIKMISEGQKYYKIREGQKVEKKITVQNKNEICDGAKCIKVSIDANGLVKIYSLPNTTDSRTVGKIVGNKIYSCKKADASDVNDNSTYVEFKGDKTQAAIVAINEQFFR